MGALHPVCCGLDVHHAKVSACVRREAEDGRVTREVREFDTVQSGLLLLLDWLVEGKCPIVAMEATGVYWRPVFHILSGNVEVIVANSTDVKPKRGKKTDKADAAWLSDLLAMDQIRPSFIPPAEVRELRDLTRLRVGQVQTRSQLKNRVHKILQDSNIKLDAVVTDLFGKSGRDMLAALVRGERDPQVLANMARGKLRKRIPELVRSLEGNFTGHHAFMVKMMLDEIEVLDRDIKALEDHIGQALAPFEKEVERLTTIPGVDATSARVIVSEVGVDMSKFGCAARLASWAGVAPGNNESAGKRRSGRTRKANKYLRRTLVECGWAAGKSHSYLGHTFRRLQARLGTKKAALAVGHKILVIAYHLLEQGTVYEAGRYAHPSDKEEARLVRRSVSTLRKLGYEVSWSKPE